MAVSRRRAVYRTPYVPGEPQERSHDDRRVASEIAILIAHLRDRSDRDRAGDFVGFVSQAYEFLEILRMARIDQLRKRRETWSGIRYDAIDLQR